MWTAGQWERLDHERVVFISRTALKREWEVCPEEAAEARVGWWHGAWEGKKPRQEAHGIPECRSWKASLGDHLEAFPTCFSIKHLPPSGILLVSSVCKTHES